MFVMYNADTMKVPVRVWLKEEKDLEKGFDYRKITVEEIR